MREVTEIVDLTGAAELYPGARKVTVDMPGRVAYVFVGQSNRALTVTGEAFDQLVKTLPAKDGVGENVADPNVTDDSPAPDAPADVEPVEAIISVVAEPAAKPKGKGKQ
jgi:hypothetical protein